MNNQHIDKLWQLLNLINDWVKFSDAKAGAILAGNGLILGIAFSDTNRISDILDHNLVSQISLITCGISLFFSIIFSLLCILPTLGVGEPSSIIFFAHIAKGYSSAQDYRNVLLSSLDANQESFIRDLTYQIWANSKVAWKKYYNITRATQFLAVTVISAFVSLVAYLV